MNEHSPAPKPVSFRACSRCHSRKVKCDGTVPSCTPCTKHNAQCNITENVTYSYETVCSLIDRIRTLESQTQALPPPKMPHVPEQIAVTEKGQYGDAFHAFQPSATIGTGADTADAIAEEVGNLILGSMSQKYVGSAAGTSFARIFFKQVGIHLEGFNDNTLTPGIFHTHLNPVTSQASLPYKAVGDFLLSVFITRVHIWWPLFHLPALRSWFHQIYVSPQTCDAFQKYVIFIVLALGSVEAAGSLEYNELLDIFQPNEYFSTAFRFFDHMSMSSNLQNLQATLLLTLWMTRTSNLSDNGSLWQISRFAMSTAIELGCHRNNPKWEFGAAEKETRNRVWWCSYALERMIAVSTGRILSVRNHCIDAHFPRITNDDSLTPSEAALSPSLSQKGFGPAIHMFRLRSISGDILESVYIARPRAGNAPSIAETLTVVESIRERLARWHSALDDHTLPGSRENLEMRIELYLLILLLNRPSPSFPRPSRLALEACAEASRSAIETWMILMERKQISMLWVTFHDVLLTGMAWLYCSWSLVSFDETVISYVADSCLTILQHLKDSDPSNLKYVRFFIVLKDKTLVKWTERRNEEVERASNMSLDEDLQAIFDTEWMGNYFDEVFLSTNGTFDLNFPVDDLLFQLPGE